MYVDQFNQYVEKYSVYLGELKKILILVSVKWVLSAVFTIILFNKWTRVNSSLMCLFENESIVCDCKEDWIFFWNLCGLMKCTKSSLLLKVFWLNNMLLDLEEVKRSSYGCWFKCDECISLGFKLNICQLKMLLIYLRFGTFITNYNWKICSFNWRKSF
jgi:hypothetical protein